MLAFAFGVCMDACAHLELQKWASAATLRLCPITVLPASRLQSHSNARQGVQGSACCACEVCQVRSLAGNAASCQASGQCTCMESERQHDSRQAASHPITGMAVPAAQALWREPGLDWVPRVGRCSCSSATETTAKAGRYTTQRHADTEHEGRHLHHRTHISTHCGEGGGRQG